MKKILFATVAALALSAGCSDDNENGASKTPIVFNATVEPAHVVMGTDGGSYGWNRGDLAGIFVNATREMTFEAGQSGTSTRLSAVMADIPAYYGTKAYAYFPASGDGESYLRASLTVPSVQTFADGANPNRMNMAAIAEVKNAEADFSFRQMGAILELGLKTRDEGIVLSKMKIEVVNPSAGKYIAGSVKIDFTGDGPELGTTVSGGTNTITVNFPDKVALGSTPVYIPVGVLPFASDGGGLQITVYDQNDNTCALPAIWTQDNEISENGALTVGRGEHVIYEVDDILYDNFDRPKSVSIKVIDNKAGAVRANQAVAIYAVADNAETEVGDYTTDDAGVMSALLNPGTYRAYCAYDAQTDAKWNSLDFTVADLPENPYDFTIYAVVFKDDFDWITPDMGGSVVLKELYESINPPVANTANEVVWASGVGVAGILAQKGWTFSTWVYIRPGSVRVGKKSATGTMTTPKMASLAVPTTLKMKLVAMPWHTVTGGVWKLEEAQLVFKIVGAGSFAEGESLKEYTTERMTSDAPASPLRKNTFEVPIYGATAETQVSVTNKLPSGVSSTMYRVMIDRIQLVEVH